MIEKFRKNNIYQIKIDTGILGVGIKDVCFQVYDIVNSEDGKPIVYGRYALTYNVDRMYDGVYQSAEHVPLSQVLLLYMDFQISYNQLPGFDANYHYVKYGIIGEMPVEIKLCPMNDNTFAFVIMNEADGSCIIKKRISGLDELQDLVVEHYGKELPVRLDAINHARLYEPFIPEMAKDIAEALNTYKCLSYNQVLQLLNTKAWMFDNDVRTVVNYGLFNGLFKLEPNMFGCLITK